MRGKLQIRRRYSKDNDVYPLLGRLPYSAPAEFPDASAQLIVTSPPYNVGKVYEKKQSLTKYLELQRKVIGECVR